MALFRAGNSYLSATLKVPNWDSSLDKFIILARGKCYAILFSAEINVYLRFFQAEVNLSILLCPTIFPRISSFGFSIQKHIVRRVNSINKICFTFYFRKRTLHIFVSCNKKIQCKMHPMHTSPCTVIALFIYKYSDQLLVFIIIISQIQCLFLWPFFMEDYGFSGLV
jgi:hypothetical protein